MPALKKTRLSIFTATTTILGACIAIPHTALAVTNKDTLGSSLNSSGHYALHLISTTNPEAALALVKKQSGKDYLTYVRQTDVNGVSWQRIRVGFFNSKSAADKVAQSLRKQYPDLWITKVSDSEKTAVLDDTMMVASTAPVSISSAAASTASVNAASSSDIRAPAVTTTGTTTGTTASASTPNPSLTPTAEQIQLAATEPAQSSNTDQIQTPVVDNKIKQLMDSAEQSMIAQEYDRAIQLYAKVLREPENQFTKQALEFTGVARERKGQKAQAKNVYDQYLERYPEGDDAVRIQQRLTALITATDAPKSPDAGAVAKKEPSRWDFYGGFSQFYRRDESTTETEDFETNSVNRSALSTDVYLTGRYRGEEYDMRTRFSGGHEQDFLDSEDSELRISTLYLDIQDKQATNSLRIGRQSSSTGGILGRFDGAILGHSFNETIKLNLVTGFPVESSTFDQINTERVFYGLNLDLGTFANAWDYNLFIIEQQNDGVLDRRAVGGELRFFKPNQTLFTLVDYDISYNELNTFFLLGSWTNESEQTFNISLDYRNSPTLTTTTAIQSQGVNTLSELLATGVTEDEARQFALDRTIRSSTATFGMVQPVTENFQLSADFTISELSDSEASGGVEAIEGTDTEYSIFIQAIGNDLIKPGDLGVVGLRFTDATTSNRYALSLNSRYPITESFRINPRLQTEYRQNTDDDTDQWFLRPSARLEYRWRRNTRFEFELGGEYSNRELTDDTSETTSYFVSLGYRHDF